MSRQATAVRDWLRQLSDHDGDDRWLAAHEQELLEAVQQGIYMSHAFHDAVEILLQTFPYFALVLHHVETWSEPLFSALIQAQDLRDNELQIRIFTQLGESYLTKGKSSAAHDAFQIALGRAQEGQFQEMMLAAYIGLIRTLYRSSTPGDDPGLVTKALALNKHVHDLSLKAALHQSILLLYLRVTEMSAEAVGHGQMAYVYWHYLENELEMAKTAYLLAAAYRWAGQVTSAERWLQYTSAQFERTPYKRQYALLSCEEGTLHLHRKNYEAAEQWFNLTLGEATQIGAVDYTAMAYQGLGVAQIGLKHYQEARTNLSQAIEYWRNLGDYFELASVHHAMGWLEAECKRLDIAHTWFAKALEICSQIPHTDQRTWMEKYIRDTVDEVNQNTGLSDG